MPPSRRTILRLIAASAGAVGLSACASADRQERRDARLSAPTRWQDGDWARVLETVVTPDGQVRYAALAANENQARGALINYCRQVARISPDERPDLFPYETDRLAYYLNAYNALAMSEAMRIEREAAGDQRSIPVRLSVMTEAAPFMVGGQTTTLDTLVDRSIRPAGDPRVHFALNWMAAGCPPLRKEPYRGAELDRQLAEQAGRFLADPRGVRAVDPGGNAAVEAATVAVSEIVTRFAAVDFSDAFARRTGIRSANPLDWLAPFAPEASPLRRATRYVTLPFDWGLNRGS